MKLADSVNNLQQVFSDYLEKKLTVKESLMKEKLHLKKKIQDARKHQDEMKAEQQREVVQLLAQLNSTPSFKPLYLPPSAPSNKSRMSNPSLLNTSSTPLGMSGSTPKQNEPVAWGAAARLDGLIGLLF